MKKVLCLLLAIMLVIGTSIMEVSAAAPETETELFSVSTGSCSDYNDFLNAWDSCEFSDRMLSTTDNVIGWNRLTSNTYLGRTATVALLRKNVKGDGTTLTMPAAQETYLRKAITLGEEKKLEISAAGFAKTGGYIDLNLRSGGNLENKCQLVRVAHNGISKVMGESQSAIAKTSDVWHYTKLIIDLQKKTMSVSIQDQSGTELGEAASAVFDADVIKALNNDVSNLTFELAPGFEEVTQTTLKYGDSFVRMDDISVKGLHYYTGDTILQNTCHDTLGWDVIYPNESTEGYSSASSTAWYFKALSRPVSNAADAATANYLTFVTCGTYPSESAPDTLEKRNGALVKQISPISEKAVVADFRVRFFSSGSQLISLRLLDGSTPAASIAPEDLNYSSKTGTRVMALAHNGLCELDNPFTRIEEWTEITREQWIKVRVVMDTDNSTVKVYIDDVPEYTYENVDLSRLRSQDGFSLCLSIYGHNTSRITLSDINVYGMGGYEKYLSVSDGMIYNANNAFDVDVQCLTGAFSSDSRLLGATINGLTIPAGGGTAISVPAISGGEAADSVKAFIWKGNLRPVMDPQNLTVN